MATSSFKFFTTVQGIVVAVAAFLGTALLVTGTVFSVKNVGNNVSCEQNPHLYRASKVFNVRNWKFKANPANTDSDDDENTASDTNVSPKDSNSAETQQPSTSTTTTTTLLQPQQQAQTLAAPPTVAVTH